MWGKNAFSRRLSRCADINDKKILGIIKPKFSFPFILSHLPYIEMHLDSWRNAAQNKTMFENTCASNWSPTYHISVTNYALRIDVLHHHALITLNTLGRAPPFPPTTDSTTGVIYQFSLFNPSKAKMVDPYQSHDPWNSFRETVQVGRNGIFYHDVTIYYFNQGRGGKWKMFLSGFSRHLDFAMPEANKHNFRLLLFFY